MLASPRLQTIILATTTQISEDEGFRAHAYLDTLGVPTWGSGDTKHDCAIGKSCTIEEARAWRDGYLAELADDLTFHIPWWSSLSTARAAALLNMAYQLGLRAAALQADAERHSRRRLCDGRGGSARQRLGAADAGTS